MVDGICCMVTGPSQTRWTTALT